MTKIVRQLTMLVLVLAVTTIFIATALTIVHFCRLHHDGVKLDEQFKSLELGFSPHDVESRLGRPVRHKKRGELFPLADHHIVFVRAPIVTQSTQYVYSINTGYVPWIWVVGFDEDERLTVAYRVE